MAYVYSKSEPAIEKSTNIRFAPYMMRLPGLAKLFSLSGMDPGANHWSEVYQFGYEKEKGNKCWEIANPKACRWAESYYDEEHPAPEPYCGMQPDNPVVIPRMYGGDGSD